jgi:hypothetical protein
VSSTTAPDPLGHLADDLAQVRAQGLYRPLRVMSSANRTRVTVDGREEEPTVSSTAPLDPLGHLADDLAQVRAQGLYRPLRVMSSANRTRVTVDGREAITLASNNYLGLNTHPKLVEAALDAVRRFGAGSGTARPDDHNILHCGNLVLFGTWNFQCSMGAVAAALTGGNGAAVGTGGWMTQERADAVGHFRAQDVLEGAGVGLHRGIIANEKHVHEQALGQAVAADDAARSLFALLGELEFFTGMP